MRRYTKDLRLAGSLSDFKNGTEIPWPLSGSLPGVNKKHTRTTSFLASRLSRALRRRGDIIATHHIRKPLALPGAEGKTIRLTVSFSRSAVSRAKPKSSALDASISGDSRNLEAVASLRASAMACDSQDDCVWRVVW